MAQKLISSKKQEILGVVSVLGAIYLGLSLYSHTKWDPSPFAFTTKPVSNYGGIAGAYISDILFTALGFSSFAIPVFILVYGIKRFFTGENHRIHLLGAILFLPSVSIFLSLLTTTFGFGLDSPGGLIGITVADGLISLLSNLGAYIVTLSMLLSSVILLSPVSLISIVARGKKPEEEKEEMAESKIYSYYNDLYDNIKVKIEDKRPPAPKVAVEIKPSKAGGFELPPIELLKTYDPATAGHSKDELLGLSALLEKKLKDFSVYGKVTQVQTGPIVTMYEFEPAPGVKINRVVSLSDDLALALKAQSVRISTIQGKSAIGIEVPNMERETVSLREIISSASFMKSTSMLTLALGKDIFGAPVTADLAKMPHLLVAGATGAGKSVSMNAMVVSILYKASPKEVKMLMVDPKLLELSYYEGIPHLISPVITNPKEASEALRKMVYEMERRYRVMAEKGARNIENFNRSVPEEEKLPYIIIFIDELADLMFAAAADVEDSIARLAQMARAAGMHLVLATQRPSVDVITGVIKANFPARISFQVTSKIDSRTILDASGAEQMIGKGDMLLMLPGMRLTRVHGAYVSEAEIKAVAEFIKAQGEPDYSIIESIEIAPEAEETFSDERDELYRKALEYAESIGEVSISSIQRRLKIGYNRAARIMELMEEDGLVGPPKGAGKPRDFIRRGRM